MVNALGSGVLEIRALLAFLPRICREVRGEPLLLPNIATWWCGQPSELAHVRANAHRMMLAPALSTRLPFDAEGTTILGSRLQTEPGGVVDALLDAEASMLVGQEAVKLSTAPAWIDGALSPRPVSIRMFLARTGQGWRVMPGGYARIGRSEDATAIAMQSGGSVADVWVVSPRPVSTEAPLTSSATPYVQSQLSVLPSRAAENLYWMGRYVERSEGLIRLLRAWHVRHAESARTDSPLMAHISAAPGFAGADPLLEAPAALKAALASATASASQVRDRFSVDGWTALNELSRTAEEALRDVTPGYETASALNVLLHRITGFSGLVHDNMYRFAGWRFLSIGRSLERAIFMAQSLAWFTRADAPDGCLDLVIEVGDSTLSHRRIYAVVPSPTTVIDLLACDAMNPRSILFQLTEIRDHCEFLPGASTHGHLSPLGRAVLRVHSGLAIRTPESLGPDEIEAMIRDLAELSELLAAAYLR
jgi:uncharacterized alpha-E superfamily protein